MNEALAAPGVAIPRLHGGRGVKHVHHGECLDRITGACTMRRNYPMLRSMIGILVLVLAVGASAETARRSQYLVVLTRSIQKSGLTALGVTIDADLNDTLVVTVDDDSV